MQEVNAPPKRRKPRLRSITVVAISPATYPQFCNDRENPYSSQPEDVRMEEVANICAQILAQTSLAPKPVDEAEKPVAA